MKTLTHSCRLGFLSFRTIINVRSLSQTLEEDLLYSTWQWRTEQVDITFYCQVGLALATLVPSLNNMVNWPGISKFCTGEQIKMAARYIFDVVIKL